MSHFSLNVETQRQSAPVKCHLLFSSQSNDVGICLISNSEDFNPAEVKVNLIRLLVHTPYHSLKGLLFSSLWKAVF